MKKYLILIVAILLIIVACTTPTAVMKSWVGHYESELYTSWGAPDLTVELKDGTKICTWKRVWSDSNGVHQGRQSFTIDTDGKVIKWSYEDMPAILRKW